MRVRQFRDSALQPQTSTEVGIGIRTCIVYTVEIFMVCRDGGGGMGTGAPKGSHTAMTHPSECYAAHLYIFRMKMKLKEFFFSNNLFHFG